MASNLSDASPDPSGDTAIQPADEGTISYVFPIEVVVVGALTEDDHRTIEQRVWSSFSEALARSV